MTLKRAATKTLKTPSPRSELAAMLVKNLPGADLSWRFGNASLTVGDKVFAFPDRSAEGLILKLPTASVDELLESGTARRLVMGTRTTREWLVVEDPLSPVTLKLARVAMDYAASSAKARPKKRTAKKSAK